MIFLVTYWWAALIGFLLYWLPTFVAGKRRVSPLAAIAWVNFLLGWTIVGWFAALIWACTAQQLRRGQRRFVSSFDKPDFWAPLDHDGRT